MPANSANPFDELIQELAGKPGVKIVRSIPVAGATDSQIESTTKEKMADIRKILNVLHNYGAVEYTREKNMSSGWYTYTWKKTEARAIQNLLLVRKREFNSLKQKLSGDGENSFIYACSRECAPLAFSEAAENNFSCPHCKNGLKSHDATSKLLKLEKKISALEKVIIGASAAKTN